MTGLDRYYSFGVKENWLRVYFDYEGSANFWNTDGDGEIPNKKKDAFLNFVKDAGMVYEDKTLKGKESKYIRFKPNSFAEKMFSLGIDSESMWAYLMCNLVYASDDPGRDHLIERIESRNGIHTIEAAEALGYGSRDYELVELD